MNRVAFPLELQMSGSAVGDLHAALQVLMAKHLVKPQVHIPSPVDGSPPRAPTVHAPPQPQPPRGPVTPPPLRPLGERFPAERHQQYFGNATAELVELYQQERRLPFTGIVDEPTATAINRELEELGLLEKEPAPAPFEVRGSVRYEHGAPVQGVLVRAIDRDLRSEEPLGEARTDVMGAYAIHYGPEQFRRAEKGTADLLVRVHDDGGARITESPIVFNAAPVEMIDLVVSSGQYAGPSEFERIQELMSPVLESVSPAELTDEELRFVAGEAGIAVHQLHFLRDAARWSAAHDLDAAVFYGLLRQGLPTAYVSLLTVGRQRLEAALRTSLAENLIPARLADSLDEVLARLEELALEAAFEPDEDAAAPPIGVLLATTPQLSPERQRQFVQFVLRHPGTDGFWERLAQEPGFDEQTVDSVRFTLESGRLVFDHLPMLTAVQGLREQRDWASTRALAELTRDDWRALTAELTAGELPREFDTPAEYAEAIAFRVEQVYPSAVLAHRIVGDSELGSGDLASFLSANPSFDLLRTRVEEFFENVAEPGQVAEHAALPRRLKEIQRAARLVPRNDPAAVPVGGLFGGVRSLMLHGFTSAHAVAQTGEAAFLETMTPIMGGAAASATYDSARVRADMSALMHQALRDVVVQPVRLLPRLIDTERMIGGEEGETATLAAMFGGGCECRHCRSVLSPAAYLVDVLQFIEKAPSGGELREILFSRRPDLEHLLLNCENTNTPLPHIDLVNELLEAEVAGLPAAERRYQTVGGSAEDRVRLRAQPQHELAAAYVRLEEQVYPWILPFSLERERGRMFAELLDVELYRIRELFERPAPEIALAYLGLADSAWRMITTSATAAATLARSWGVASLAELDAVPTLLARAGLEYDELRALLGSAWLTAAAPAVEIDCGSDLCDPADDRLVWPPTATDDDRVRLFDRVHRFLRLQRALGWTRSQLDAVLGHLARPQLDEDAVIELTWLMRLAERLRRPVIEVAGLTTSDALARALGLTVGELDTLVTLTGVDPFAAGAASSQRLVELLGHLELVRASGTELAELNYLLRHHDQVPAVFAPEPAATVSYLRSLHRAISERQEALLTAEPSRSFAEIRPQVEETIVEHLADRLGLEPDLVAMLVRRTTDADGALVDAVVHAATDPSAPAIEELLPLREHSNFDELPAPTVQAAAALLVRLDKAQRMLRPLGITARQLGRAHAVRAAAGFLDLNRLPTAIPTDDAATPALYHGWERLVRARRLQAALPAADRDLFDLLAGAVAPAYADLADPTSFDELAATTGWNLDPQTQRRFTAPDPATGEPVEIDALLELTRHLGLRPSRPDDGVDSDFVRLETSERLFEAVQHLRRWRVAPADLATWAVGTPAQVSASLEVAARARFPSVAAWYQALTPRMDRLRERKRDALLAYLLANPLTVTRDGRTQPRWSDAAGIHAHYLLDVEMSACQLTSRIQAAGSAVQLFAQRCLMNLEPDVLLADEDARYWKRWQWMKHYRVSEAGRKIFLFPENWIEPELRDDKSPFFEHLENELLQVEVTRDNVERAYETYLASLDEVGRLDVRALYEERAGDRRLLHVIARTFNEPAVYYYRKRWPDRSWTAWEKLEVSIEGDHLIPVVQNGRLMLFWPRFREIGPEDDRRWEISLAWTEHKRNQWQPPKVGRGKLLLPLYQPSDLTFRPETEDGQLSILVFRQIRVPGRLGEYDADKYSLCGNRFVVDLCDGDLDVLPVSPARIFLHPERTDAYGMHFVEDDTAGDELLVNTRLIEDDRLELDPAVLDMITELIRVGGVFGALYAIALGGAIAIDRLQRIMRQVSSVPLLEVTPGRFSLLPTHQYRQLDSSQPFFCNVERRTYLVTPDVEPVTVEIPVFDAPGSGGFFDPLPGHGGRGGTRSTTTTWWLERQRFETFYHAYLCPLHVRFREAGIDGILAPPASEPRLYRQLYREQPTPAHRTRFQFYEPTSHVWKDHEDTYDFYPYERFDFAWDGAYSLYNWELFFHIPLLVADRLSKSQRFEEAQRWFHYIFDPTDVSAHEAPAKYWRIKPFFDLAQRWGDAPETLDEMMRRLAAGSRELEEQIEAWRDDPFNPHLIARMRLLAYMKTVVMKYVDNLIAWGDSLFRLDTRESINEAMQLYVLAAEILGPRPPTVARQDTEALSYAEVRDRLDAFSNLLVDLETSLPADLGRHTPRGDAVPPAFVLYFCIPNNEKLLSYWDTVADRLFKIRHCMDIEGRVRALAFFEPPIDPGLLARARAAGLDLREIVAQALDAPLPHYRYPYLLQKALEFCNEVRSLGGALLAALEKRDAEELALLRSRHELTMLQLIGAVRGRQIDEAAETLEGLRASRALAETRLEYYRSREFMSRGEISHTDHLHSAHGLEVGAQSLALAASLARLIPDFKLGSPATLGTTFGGTHIGGALQDAGRVLSILASQYTFEASMASLLAGYERRQDDWNLQTELAAKEIAQLDRQILAAEIRHAIAALEHRNHERQIEQGRETDAFLKAKFTNQQLYSWMASQLASLHYQSYRMAFELARRAERAAQHELGVPPSERSTFSFVGFGHWDSLRKGLLAGERLHHDLRRLDAAFMEHNRRELEITRHISLAMLNPAELVRLRETGQCEIQVPEILFDLDFPGHYRRRIRSLSLTIPGVTGPYTSVSATLTLLNSRVRHSDAVGAGYAYTPGDERFTSDPIGRQAIVTSSAQGDSGLFELSFRDERYLPFEGAGAISTWRLELPREFRPFDYDTISDVILHMQYTSRDGGDTFRRAAEGQIRDALNLWLEGLSDSRIPLTRLFSLRQEFSAEFHRFLHPAAEEEVHEARLSLEPRHFPHFLRGRQLVLTHALPQVQVMLKPRSEAHHGAFAGRPVTLRRDGAELVAMLNASPPLNGLPVAEFTVLGEGAPSATPALGDWTLRLERTGYPPEVSSEAHGRLRLDPERIEDVYLLVSYRVGTAAG